MDRPMTIPRRIRTSGVPEVLCHRCRSAVWVIEGDGPPVCMTCVYSLGRTANDPDGASDVMLTGLLARHGDVLDLRRVDTSLTWVWK